MKELVSPKQVARAIGVSESSLKRWCDRGLLGTVRTAGGHRRIPISSVVAFLRATQQTLVDPQVLGLPATCGQTSRVSERSRATLLAALLNGEEEVCRQIVADLWLAGQPIAAICDDVIARAFCEIGSRWSCQQAEVYQERRACEIMVRVLHELRLGTPPGDPRWLAIGGTPPGDQYVLPTTMVELTLQSCGWTSRSVGSSVPFESLAKAIADLRPRLFWMSVSYVESPGTFIEQFRVLQQAADEVGAIVVVGGYAMQGVLRQQISPTLCCDSMRQIADFATKFRNAS